MNSSLRLRLVAIILGPLLLIAALVATWAVFDARDRANDRFDRSLLSTVLAISRDVAASDGDALSPETNRLLQDTSGGPVFYHVYAPDGAFVTGYATPPVPDVLNDTSQGNQTSYDGRYLGKNVRVLKFTDIMSIDGLTGEFTFTVWQDASLRRAIIQDLSLRTFLVMSSLIFTVALVVWFGVRLGLKPLLALEASIARRSPNDLTAIQRQVPTEARGLVATLNRLLGQVSATLDAKDVFISNAAHQLRNPIAGVVTMADAVQSAKSFEDMKIRSVELGIASREVGDLANKLLALERASAQHGSDSLATFDLRPLVAEVVQNTQEQADRRGVRLNLHLPEGSAKLLGDETMLKEALLNLVENALLHGGDVLSDITIRLARKVDHLELSVQDNGCGIPPNQIEKARERFNQIRPSRGSGLGLAIADAVATAHGGQMTIKSLHPGLLVVLKLPR